jgi:hypothetical protein
MVGWTPHARSHSFLPDEDAAARYRVDQALCLRQVHRFLHGAVGEAAGYDEIVRRRDALIGLHGRDPPPQLGGELDVRGDWRAYVHATDLHVIKLADQGRQA